MTKEAILERLEVLRAGRAELESKRVRLVANINATDGAIQDCEFWLEAAEREEREKVSPSLSLVSDEK